MKSIARKKQTKQARLLQHLQSGKSITSLDAVKLVGTTRLSGYIHRLRQQGYRIDDVLEKAKDGTHYKRYFLFFIA